MSNGRRPRLAKLIRGLRHAFAVAGPHGPLRDEDRELLRRLAMAIVRRRMAGPAVLFLESVRPLNYVGSQALVFLRPFLTPLFHPRDYDRLVAILERREGLAALLEAIERAIAGPPEGAR